MHTISCVIGTAGHIDHGKTSLVRALTGVDTDRLVEEKRRGISIDLGFAFMDIASDGSTVRAAVVDVPGHERFIRNMLAGATGISVVLFCVAADDGIMPQTGEHLAIVRLLGIRRAVFAVTKSDLVGEERVKEVAFSVEDIVRGTVLEGSPIAAVSAATGQGMERLKALIGEAVLSSPPPPASGFFRLPVDRSFHVKGFGTVVSGTVASGAVTKGADLMVFPAGQRVKVRGIQSLFFDVESASEGQRAALNLSGITHTEAKRGFVIADPALSAYRAKAAPRGRQAVDCAFEFLDDREGPKDAALLKVHHLTGDSLATLRIPEGRAGHAGPAYGRLLLKGPLLMMRGDRFILRDPAVNATIGGGVVILPLLSGPMPGPAPGASFAADPGGAALVVLRGLLNAEAPGMDATDLSIMLNLRPEELHRLVEENRDAVGVMGGFIVDIKAIESLKRRVVEMVSAHHASCPMEPGIKEESLVRALLKGFPARAGRVRLGPLVRGLINTLVSGVWGGWGVWGAGGVGGGLGEGGVVLKRASGRLALSVHVPAASAADAPIEAAISRLFPDAFSQPGTGALAGLPFKAADVERVLAHMLRAGTVVRLKEGSYISGSALKRAREALTGHVRRHGGIRAAEFRDLLGCGRKLAIEILEHFDGERLTLRKGDVRTLRA
jgi:selenocysteine-specific elongation factor